MKERVDAVLKKLSLELVIISAVFLASLIGFGWLVHEVFGETGNGFDNDVIVWVAAHRTPALTSFMEFITFFGSSSFLLPAYILLSAWLISKKKKRNGIAIAIIGLSSTLLMNLLKEYFKRHRPPVPVIKQLTSYSFPSGHALASCIFYTILCYLVIRSPLRPVYKTVLVSVLIVLALLIGLSRIVLNVHYATDVMAGFCIGTVWVIFSFAVTRKFFSAATVGKAE
jgi:undecaprenyl-diphosphatase